MKKIVIILTFLYVGSTLTFWRRSRTPRNAGVLPITADARNNYWIFLGREAFGKNKGTWSDFGGEGFSMESPADIAEREFDEETRKVYKNEDLDMNFFVDNTSGTYRMFIVPLPYVHKDIFLNAGQIDKEDSSWLGKYNLFMRGGKEYYEKDDFLWVNAYDFINQLQNQSLQNPHPEYDTHIPEYGIIKIRRSFADYFMSPCLLKPIKEKIEEITGKTIPFALIAEDHSSITQNLIVLKQKLQALRQLLA